MDTLFIFFNGRPPLPSLPLHLQSMVGRNGLFSGYKSQRTKGHREEKRGRTRRQKQKNTEGEESERKRYTVERRTEPRGGRGRKTGGKEPRETKKKEEKNQGKTGEENVTEAERSIGQLTHEHQPRLRLHHPPEQTDRRTEHNRGGKTERSQKGD